MPIEVKTSVYEGPLDLLLELIEKRKLLINDISLAQVADEYMAKISSLPEVPLGEAAEFISLAATLLLIKSRSLLPNLALSEEESRDIKELEYRLAIYQLLKEAAQGIGRLNLPMLYEGRTPEQEPMYLPDPTVTLSSLLSAAHVLIDGFPHNVVLPQTEVKKIMSLEEMIQRMATRITAAFRTSFKDFVRTSDVAGTSDVQAVRHHVIVSFLALLELVKQGIIKATQEERHGDITLESDAVKTPTYE